MRWMTYPLEKKGKKGWIFFGCPLLCSPFSASPLPPYTNPTLTPWHKASVAIRWLLSPLLLLSFLKERLYRRKKVYHACLLANGKLYAHTPFFMQVWAG
jgi:hypothetical protein